MDQYSTVQHLSEAITHAAAPAFFLGAVTGLVSIIQLRLSGVMTELAAATRSGQRSTPMGRSLLRRAQILHSAVSYSVAAGMSTTLLLALTFLAAFVRMSHLYLAGGLFIASTVLTALSLFKFYQEVRYELKVLKSVLIEDRPHGSNA